MYLAYLDDSESYDRRYQVVGGIILKDQHFSILESLLGFVIDHYVPDDLKESFEFHASDLFQCRGPFSTVKREKALEILSECVNLLGSLQAPIIYGAVDIDRHRQTIVGNADPISVGFRICVEAVESWFEEKAPDDLGLVIFDDTQKKEVKQSIQAAFRACRKQVRELGGQRGLLSHIHDDLYFGNSAFSLGMQAADVCTYFINRHLNGREDTEHLYEQLRPNIYKSRLVPD